MRPAKTSASVLVAVVLLAGGATPPQPSTRPRRHRRWRPRVPGHVRELPRTRRRRGRGIDLGRGVFRRAKTDQDLIQIIRSGIPGTAMPASNFAEAQAEQVVAYLRSVAATKRSASGRWRRRSRQGGVRRQGRVRDVPPRQRQRLAPGPRPEQHRSAAARRRARDVGPRSGPRKSSRQPLPIASSRRTGPRRPGRLLNLDSFTVQMLDSEGAAAIVRESRSSATTASSTRRRCRRTKTS